MTDDPYFVAEVQTATPQQLRLMLIEGALRYARRVTELWAEKKLYEAGQAVDRCRDIVTELMTRMNRARQPELTARVASVYAWMYSEITQAHISHDIPRMGEVIRVLEVERDTWQQLCELLPAAPVDHESPPEADGLVASDDAAKPPLPPPCDDDPLADIWSQQASNGLSFDA
ncbi:MAG: flagellar export chaperone FliS [Pirellulales bacterium]